MVKLWNYGCGVTIIRFSICLLLALFFLCSIFQTKIIFDDVGEKQTLQTANSLTCLKDPLCFIPQSTRSMWDARDFLIVFGFPSLDIPIRRWRRQLQRTTCWQFPEVATLENNYTGAMLVLYLLARHPMHNYVLSAQLLREAAQWQDIVIHPMNEGRSSTNKIVSDNGYWGVEAEIGSSRKTFFWFQFALQQFPRAPYFAKGDDDTFVSVPQFLADLRRLPRKRVYWGRYNAIYGDTNTKGGKVRVRYMHGFCFTLSRDAAESFVSYKPMQRLMTLPYNNKTQPEFFAMTMEYEDAMVGRLLLEVKFPVIFVVEGYYRFYTSYHLPVTELVLAIHKPEEHEYYKYMNMIMIRKTAPNATRIIKKGSDFYFMRHPLNI